MGPNINIFVLIYILTENDVLMAIVEMRRLYHFPLIFPLPINIFVPIYILTENDLLMAIAGC